MNGTGERRIVFTERERTCRVCFLFPPHPSISDKNELPANLYLIGPLRQGPRTFLILGRTLTAATLPRFIHLWANNFFPYPWLAPRTPTSLINKMATLNTMIASTLCLLSTHPLITGAERWPCLVHLVLYNRLTSGLALIDDFQDLMHECEKRIYSLVVYCRGRILRCKQKSVEYRLLDGKRVLRVLAGSQQTKKLEGDLKYWIRYSESGWIREWRWSTRWRRGSGE